MCIKVHHKVGGFPVFKSGILHALNNALSPLKISYAIEVDCQNMLQVVIN